MGTRKRPVFGLLILAWIAPSCGGSVELEHAPATHKPDVFLISIDTLRQDHMSVYGYPRETTPFLDQLAKSSLVFERVYTTASWTLVAHMSLLTGTYPRQHGVMSRTVALADEIPTLAERLKAEGYHTMGFHFPGWLDPHFGYGRGFDRYERHRDVEEAQRHIFRALKKAPRDRPIFCFVHLFDVHNGKLGPENGVIYSPPQPYAEFFMEGARARLDGLDGRALWKRGEGLTDEKQHEAIVALYDGGIRHIDAKLGEWVARLRRMSLFDDSLFVVTSDHGEGLRQRFKGYSGHGGTFEEGLRVPLLVRLPGAERGGERLQSAVSHVDVVPTVLDHLGLRRDERLAGHSLLADGARPEPIFAERVESDTVLLWPWKWTIKHDENRQTLFNLIKDPEESRNLLKGSVSLASKAVLQALTRTAEQARARRFQPAVNTRKETRLDSSSTALLRGLGYADDPE